MVGELGGLWSEVVTVAVVIVRNSFGVLVAGDCIKSYELGIGLDCYLGKAGEVTV